MSLRRSRGSAAGSRGDARKLGAVRPGAVLSVTAAPRSRRYSSALRLPHGITRTRGAADDGTILDRRL